MKLFPYDTGERVYLFNRELFKDILEHAWRQYRKELEEKGLAASERNYNSILEQAIKHSDTVSIEVTSIGSTVSIEDYIIIYTHPYLYVFDGNTGRLLKKA